MKNDQFRALLGTWCQSDVDGNEGFSELRGIIDFLEGILFEKYEPTEIGPHRSFRSRLARWIGSAATEEDQKMLFITLRHLTYLGQEEMKSAMATAYSRNTLMWLQRVNQIAPFDANAQQATLSALSATAFTAITDSFRIGDFIRQNGINGHATRYVWEAHVANWNSDIFHAEPMEGGSKRYLVLLEDFVGSGSQMETAVELACSAPANYHVLLCPMVICPDGANLARTLQCKHPNLTYSPVLELPTSAFLTSVPGQPEHADFAMIRATLKSVHPKVKGTPGSWLQERSELGYRDTGAIFCKYDNCPDNTIPALHHKSDLGWEPLFPRTSREPL